MAKGEQAKTGAPIKAAWKLYEAGDVVAARREAKKVLAEGSDEDKKQARDLIGRTKIPPMAFLLGAMAAAIILFMIILALVRG